MTIQNLDSYFCLFESAITCTYRQCK